MATNFKISLSKTFAKRLKKRVAGYEFAVGILEDAPHKEPRYFKDAGDLSRFAGGPVRKKTVANSGLSIAKVFVSNMNRIGVDLLRRPFQQKNSDIVKFSQAFLRSVFAKTNLKRVENLLQAVVRNPILRGDYGSNRGSTADLKGFDRHLIDTGQTFKSIRARVYRKGPTNV